MQQENLNMEEITASRRAAVEASIRPISTENLKALGEKIFPYLDDSWREAFFAFIKENSGATFFHATTTDRIHFVYCPEREKGMWFLPGKGKGPMQAKGLGILKEIVKGL